jgi:hypothetical protein
MVYEILRSQSGDQPEIRRHDEQEFSNGPFKSTFREWRDGKQVWILGEYDLPEDLHATGHYVILSWSKDPLDNLITYRKYPSGAYERLVSGFGRESRYFDNKARWIGPKVQKGRESVSLDQLPADVRTREEHRELMYTTRGNKKRYREEAFAVPGRPSQYEYRRVLIDDHAMCVIEDLHIEKTDDRGNVYVLYDVIWPDGSREMWENHVLKEFGDEYSNDLSDLFSQQQQKMWKVVLMPQQADMRVDIRAMLSRLHKLNVQ